MKLIFMLFKRIWFEIESLFFSLMKRTKNQGWGIVVKAQYSDFLKIFAPRRFILFAPEIADFVGDLLRSFRQTSSVSVRSQNPTIPRPEKIMNYGLWFINYWNENCALKYDCLFDLSFIFQMNRKKSLISYCK